MSKAINIEAIRIDGGTQPRAEINNDAVSEYAESVKGGTEFPPIVVFWDGVSYWLGDGFHRVHAFRTAGRASINADVREGTQRDAILFSVGANTNHGLRRTNADKRKAVETLLNDEEWGAWSNNHIAKQCGVSLDLVNRARSSLTESLSEKPAEHNGAALATVASEKPAKRTYTTKHGTVATMETANIGRARTDNEPEPAASKPKRSIAGEIDPEFQDYDPRDDDLAEARDTIDELAAQNEKLKDRIAIECMDATDQEKTDAHFLIEGLRKQVKTLEAELDAIKKNRDLYLNENAQLKRQCKAQRSEIDRLKKGAANAEAA